MRGKNNSYLQGSYMTQNKDNDKEHENMTKGLFRLGARAWCSGTGTILSTSLNEVPKANTIKTVPNTALPR